MMWEFRDIIGPAEGAHDELRHTTCHPQTGLWPSWPRSPGSLAPFRRELAENLAESSVMAPDSLNPMTVRIGLAAFPRLDEARTRSGGRPMRRSTNRSARAGSG